MNTDKWIRLIFCSFVTCSSFQIWQPCTEILAQPSYVVSSKTTSLDQSDPSLVLTIDTWAIGKSVYTQIPKGWRTDDEFLTKYFSPDFSRPFSLNETAHGQTFVTRLSGRYYGRGPDKREKFLIATKLKAIGKYPLNLLSQPVNDEHRLSQRNDHFTVDSLLVKYNRAWLSASIFSGVGHTDWRDWGDLFDLFPEQFDVDNYKRVSGRRVPRGAEVNVRGAFGDLQLIAGPELVWGNGKSAFARWNVRLGGIDAAAFYADEEIVWGREGEHLRAAEISFRARPEKLSRLALAVLYRPFRLNWPYTFVEEVQRGQSFQGTKYKIYHARTRQKDALGVIVEFERARLPFFFNVHTTYTYCGLASGNKSEISIGLEKMLARSFNLDTEFTYRTPLKEPNPRIFEGTVDNSGPNFLSPRGPDDPFWVNADNRKAYLLSLILLYDPTPATRFNKYRPNILEEWNLNPLENASFAFALRYTASHFPTATDLQTYVNEFGNRVWEPSSTFGLWPTRRPIHFFEFLGRIGLSKRQNNCLILKLKAGQSLATSGLAYGSNTPREKPITGLTDIALSGKWKAVNFGVEFGRSVWGPEEWHRRFGATIDRRYGAQVSIQTSRHSYLELRYTRYREVDNKYLALELGPFDEMIFTYKFYLAAQKGLF